MRLLVCSLNYVPESIGIGKYTGEMAVWLSDRGHQVDVITGLPHYPSWTINDEYLGKGFHTEIIDGVRVMRTPLFVPPKHRLGAVNRIALETSYSINAMKYWWSNVVNGTKYDIVLAVSPPLQTGVYPLLYGKLRGVPWVFHIQDLQVDAAIRLGFLQGKRLEHMLYGAENFVLRCATRVSTISEAMMRHILVKGVSKQRLMLFPNWANLDLVRPMPLNNQFRSEVGATDDTVLVMYAGNIGDKQGLELVLQAAHQMRSDPRVCFVLVGSGAARTRLEKMSKEFALNNLTFRSVQPLERFSEVLAAADIQLVVQKHEAADLVMPSKLTNILAAGKPTLATAAQGTQLYEVLTKHKVGVTSPPGNVPSFVEALQGLIGNQGLRDEMARKARRYAEEFLDKEVILGRFEGDLLQVIKEVKEKNSHLER